MGVPDANDILSDEHAVEQAKEYLRQGETVEFYEFIATTLLKHRPLDPVVCCLHYVERNLKLMEKGEPMSYKPDEKVDFKILEEEIAQDTYMKKYHVSDFVDKWILALIAEKRGAHLEDAEKATMMRLKFHKDYLTRLKNESARAQ